MVTPNVNNNIAPDRNCSHMCSVFLSAGVKCEFSSIIAIRILIHIPTIVITETVKNVFLIEFFLNFFLSMFSALLKSINASVQSQITENIARAKIRQGF